MAEKMLKAAALTYVAGVLASALEILRYILMFTSRDWFIGEEILWKRNF